MIGQIRSLTINNIIIEYLYQIIYLNCIMISMIRYNKMEYFIILLLHREALADGSIFKIFLVLCRAHSESKILVDKYIRIPYSYVKLCKYHVRNISTHIGKGIVNFSSLTIFCIIASQSGIDMDKTNVYVLTFTFDLILI